MMCREDDCMCEINAISQEWCDGDKYGHFDAIIKIAGVVMRYFLGDDD